MKTHRLWIWAIVTTTVASAGGLQAQTPVGTAFSYQGQLRQAGAPFDGLADFEFTLWDDASSSDPNDLVAGPLALNDVDVDRGLFTIVLDFGQNVFTGQARWLEIVVNGTTLTPRQELTPAPYALALPGVWTQQNSQCPNIFAGHGGNLVNDGAIGVAIGGGGGQALTNVAHDNYGTVGGGAHNVVGLEDGDPTVAPYATIGGGYMNYIPGRGGTIAGGEENKAGPRATVGGGRQNEASASYTTIGGGYLNSANDGYATVPGGHTNTAAGTCSLAAGYKAQALNEGAFVWSDRSGDIFASTSDNQFLIRAAGGVGINTNAPTSPLTVAGMVESLSDGFKFPDGTVQTSAATGAGDAWSLYGNAGTDPITHFIGTTDDAALELRVNSERALRIEPDPYSPNLIAGYPLNSVAPNAHGATIGGGGNDYYPNRLYDSYGTISGGRGNVTGSDDGDAESHPYGTIGGGAYNEASGNYATVGGGGDNRASAECATVGGGLVNQATQTCATIAGGDHNEASQFAATVGGGQLNDATGSYASVGGGASNVAAGTDSTVGGGRSNIASGYRATIPGGSTNSAGGAYSFAAGRRAKAFHDGSFVWGDSTDADFESTGVDQLLVRAAGGVGINTNAPQAMLHVAGAVALEGWVGAVADTALELRVNNERALRIEPDPNSPNLIGGYSGNSVADGVFAATISGGGVNGFPNSVTQSYSTVGGGRGNTAGGASSSDNDATVGGGRENVASGNHSIVGGGYRNDASGVNATVGGGYDNDAIGSAATIGGGWSNRATGADATVSGGKDNTASGYQATVGGGLNNTADGSNATISGGATNVASNSYTTVGGGRANVASGGWSTVPGGSSNTAAGEYSLAAGRRAKALHRGSFVWGDSTDADFDSAGSNQFLIRAGGGVGINTNAPSSPLTVDGMIESLSGGFKFPDGTTQATVGWGLSGNAGTDPNNNFIGTTDDVALELRVNNECALRIEPVDESPNIIGGHYLNSADPGAYGVTISGGGGSDGFEDYPNTARDSFCAIGGGLNNVAGVGDGEGKFATIAGGHRNTASGYTATIPGGFRNKAAGRYSFAAGFRANAVHNGSFVWADAATDSDFESTGADQFLIRAGGGVGIGTNDPQYELDVAGDIQCVALHETSDRRLKCNIAPLGDALAKALRLRGVRFDWNHPADPQRKFSKARQVGFVAQEVAAVLPEVVSQGENGIYAVNYGRVVPVLVEAVKELHGVVQEKDAQIAEQCERIEDQQERIDAQQAQIADLTARLERIETSLGAPANDAKGGGR
jgi:hypothetical protein